MARRDRHAPRSPVAVQSDAPPVRPDTPGSEELAIDTVEVDERECTVHEGLRNLVQLLPRVMRGLRRRSGERDVIDGVALGSRHGSALALLREDPLTVGTLASALGLNLATVSGLVADLEQVGFVARSADPADRRRIIVRVAPGHEKVVDAWLEGATAPIVRALSQLSSEERASFVKAMAFLDAELNASRCSE
jgi:DNA-binding MarR family transcriptional regulator